MIEAVRAGYIFARDGKQYRRWSRKNGSSGRSPALSKRSLEAQILGLAATNPEYVIVETRTP